MPEWRYGKSGRQGESNVHRGRILPRGDFVNAHGSRFTPTGVTWSKEEADMHERQDWEERHGSGE